MSGFILLSKYNSVFRTKLILFIEQSIDTLVQLVEHIFHQDNKKPLHFRRRRGFVNTTMPTRLL